MLIEMNVIKAKLRLCKAHDDCDSAEFNLDKSFYDMANNRAYFCMYHAIRALMALDGENFKSKISIIWYFKKNYILTGYFDPRMAEMFEIALKSRLDSDYSDYYSATKNEARRNTDNAVFFLDSIENYAARRINLDFTLPASPN